MILLALIAALSATPLRLAEAADDQARALAAIGGDGGADAADGGVGDDSDATIRAERTSIPAVVTCPFGILACPPHRIPHAVNRSPARLSDPPPHTAGGLPRRLALLQCLLC